MAGRITVKAPDGRELQVEVGGPPDGLLLISHTGTPDGGMLYEPRVRAGAERGIRHATYARPGYGGSDRAPGRSVADCAADVAAIADALGAGELLIEGASGGGPHAIACAALLPERVLAAASVAGVAPYGAQGLDWTAGMGQENLDEFAAAVAGEQQLTELLEREAAGMAGADAEALLAAFGDLLCDADAAALTGEFGAYMAASTSAALAAGVWGWFDDDLAFLRDWGFDLASVQRPVSVWHGGQDRFVPCAHGEWLAAHIPAARRRLFPDEGHLSITIGRYGEMLDDLLAAAGRG